LYFPHSYMSPQTAPAKGAKAGHPTRRGTAAESATAGACRPPRNCHPVGAVRASMSTRPVIYLQAAKDRLRLLAGFIRYTVATFVDDGCLVGAGALSYTTLVALVPITAIALAVLSAFPVFADKRDALLASVFQAFVPEVSGEVEWWFRYFA